MAPVPIRTAVRVFVGRRTSFPGVLRYDDQQAFGCEHCKQQTVVSYRSYVCPELSYRALQTFAIRHGSCREYAGKPHLARASLKLRDAMERDRKRAPARPKAL